MVCAPMCTYVHVETFRILPYVCPCPLVGSTGERHDAPILGDVVMQQVRKLVSKKELKSVHGIPYSFAHIARLEKAKQFPTRIMLGACRVAWYEDEIEEWKASRPRAA